MNYGYQQHPVPKRSSGMSGCFITMLMVGGAGLLGLIVMSIALHRTPEQRKRDEEKAAALAASAASAEAKAKAEEEELLRKQCKVKPPLPVFPVADQHLVRQCQDIVRDSLKAPSSASFPWAYEDTRQLRTDDGCNRIYTSWVDAKNAFGVELRTRYECTYDPRTAGYRTRLLE